MSGRIHSYLSMGTVDGPGIRFVLFLQGCFARCIYCHNPDTWDQNAGSLMEPEEIVEKVLRYRAYYGKQPQITVSGGEALNQIDFVIELFRLCKKNKIHTALDTSGFGCMDDAKISMLLEVTDLCLLDIKFTLPQAYEEFTGIPMEAVVSFLDQLEEHKVLTWIRMVIVSGLNDTEDEMNRLFHLTKDIACIEKLELLPFRKLCLEKYQDMDLLFPLSDTRETDKKKIDELYDIWNRLRD